MQAGTNKTNYGSFNSSTSMQSKIDELSSIPNKPLMFGRTAATQPLSDWATILDAKPDSINRQQSAVSQPPSASTQESSRNIPSLDNSLIDLDFGPEKLSQPIPVSSNILPKEEGPKENSGKGAQTEDSWGEFGNFGQEDINTEHDDFADFVEYSPDQVPDSETLLSFSCSNILHAADPLFESLKNVNYTMKRRVIAHPETKTFIAGYLESLRVVARIMAGRRRRASVDKPSDKEARLVEAEWNKLRPRLMALGIKESDMPQLSSKVVFDSVQRMEIDYCPVCGLSKAETVKGQRPVWDPIGGHVTCLALWKNRKVWGSI